MTEELTPDKELTRPELATAYGQWLDNRHRQIFGAVLSADKLPHPLSEIGPTLRNFY